jgi:hypothetical protein
MGRDEAVAVGGLAANLQQILGRFLGAEVRVWRGDFELSTGKAQCLAGWCRECKQNTICCGFLLTRTIDSAIFSSAAVNGF